MKTIFLIVLIVVFTLPISGCIDHGDKEFEENIDYRQDMRYFVQDISSYSKTMNPDFIVVTQNGHQLLTTNGETDGPIKEQYLRSIDGIGREDLFFGYDSYNMPTPTSETYEMTLFMDIARNNGIKVLITDYCSKKEYIDSSYLQNTEKGYISFAANSRDLNSIPEYPAKPYNVNSKNITSLASAENFLYLIEPGSFHNKTDFLESIQETNYDIVIIDLFYEDVALTKEEVDSLKIKDNGASRLVIAYMSIGEAEDYRYYWKSEWESNPPSWMEEENPDWEGNFKVQYWEKEWQDLIYGESDSYLDKIIHAGFNGVYLDIIDAFEYFEEREL